MDSVAVSKCLYILLYMTSRALEREKCTSSTGQNFGLLLLIWNKQIIAFSVYILPYTGYNLIWIIHLNFKQCHVVGELSLFVYVLELPLLYQKLPPTRKKKKKKQWFSIVAGLWSKRQCGVKVFHYHHSSGQCPFGLPPLLNCGKGRAKRKRIMLGVLGQRFRGTSGASVDRNGSKGGSLF